MIRKLLVFAFVFCAFSSIQAADRPNVVFILADDLGWADTTLYGQTKLNQTPNLERLAARGMTFNRAYTASPLCSPTRSSILTGLHPARTGLTTPNCHTPQIVLKATVGESAVAGRKLTNLSSVSRLDPKYETIAERLKNEGYSTGHFGKWHLGAEPYSPLEHGFDVDIPHWHGPGPAGSFVAPWKFKTFKEAYPNEHIEDRMGDEAVKFIEAHQDEPFFLNYWQFSVHAPFDAKAELIEKHRARIDPADEQRSPTYAAMVESLDDNVGKVLDAIDRLKLAEKTIIVFYSDNGGNMYNEIDETTPTANRPLRGGKANAWDGGVRVPGIVVWPGEVEAGARSDELITSTDFFPTLLEMLGLESKQNFDGVSIVPALRGEALDRDAIFTFFPHSTGVPDTLPPSTAIYSGDWKLIRLFHNGQDGQDELRLFNLAEDIGEASDVASLNPERVETMNARLETFLDETGAVFPRLNPAWSPAAAELAELGWSATKNCALNPAGDFLHVECSGNDPNFRVQLAEPLDPGAFRLVLGFRRTTTGAVEIRWAEQGVTPAYGRDRLARVTVDGDGWQIADLELKNERPLTSIRIDPGSGKGTFDLQVFEIQQDGKPPQRLIRSMFAFE